MRRLFQIFTLLGFLALTLQTVQAQCPMCKASVESEHGNATSELAKGLNMGILYLFVLPYGAAMILAIVWYTRRRREKRLAQAGEIPS